jgi:hypothetical protein
LRAELDPTTNHRVWVDRRSAGVEVADFIVGHRPAANDVDRAHAVIDYPEHAGAVCFESVPRGRVSDRDLG